MKTLLFVISVILILGGLSFQSIPRAHAKKGGGADTGGGDAWTQSFNENEMQWNIARARMVLEFNFNFLELILNPDNKAYENSNDHESGTKARAVYALMFPNDGKDIFEILNENSAVVKDACYDKLGNIKDGSIYFKVDGEFKVVPGKFCLNFKSMVNGKVDRADLFQQILALSAHEYIELVAKGKNGVHEAAEYVQQILVVSPANLQYVDPFQFYRRQWAITKEALENIESLLRLSEVPLLPLCLSLQSLRGEVDGLIQQWLSSASNFIFPARFKDMLYVNLFYIQASMLPTYCIDPLNPDHVNLPGFSSNDDEDEDIADFSNVSEVKFSDWSGAFSNINFPEELQNEALYIPTNKKTVVLKKAMTNMQRYADKIDKIFKDTEKFIVNDDDEKPLQGETGGAQ